MEDRIGEQLAAFDRLYKEMDEGYHLYAKGRGLSDTALWLLYSLYERGAAQSQRELCSAWHYPPQTVNSAIKALEERGLVELATIPGNRKNKQVLLTPKGEEEARRVVLPLMEAERAAFRDLGEAEREALLSLTRRYVGLLWEKMASAG